MTRKASVRLGVGPAAPNPELEAFGKTVIAIGASRRTLRLGIVGEPSAAERTRLARVASRKIKATIRRHHLAPHR